mmetsp:Transcript_12894/g.42171  ORF Transcript_12894/g.42171 Transcript_12894/m.42171 type:complete len:254 (+) Transcript_12894:393-1154(+)
MPPGDEAAPRSPIGVPIPSMTWMWRAQPYITSPPEQLRSCHPQNHCGPAGGGLAGGGLGGEGGRGGGAGGAAGMGGRGLMCAANGASARLATVPAAQSSAPTTRPGASQVLIMATAVAWSSTDAVVSTPLPTMATVSPSGLSLMASAWPCICAPPSPISPGPAIFDESYWPPYDSPSQPMKPPSTAMSGDMVTLDPEVVIEGLTPKRSGITVNFFSSGATVSRRCFESAAGWCDRTRRASARITSSAQRAIVG